MFGLTMLVPSLASADDQTTPPPPSTTISKSPSATSQVLPALGAQTPPSEPAPSVETKAIGPADEAVHLVTKATAKLKKNIAAESQKLFPDTQFKLATDSFPAFCTDWQRKLHSREVDNRNHLAWKDLNGWKSASYTGYSNIVTCECKKSSHGIPIGKLSYSEFTYNIVGHDVDEAFRATPKETSITVTTEIFRWAKTHWVY
jgi:hypothetical protein